VSGQVSDPSRWEHRYAKDDIPWDLGTPDPYLQAFVADYSVASGSVLEIGCGTGTNAAWMAQRGLDVYATDVSPTAVQRAKATLQQAGVRCTVERLDFLNDPLPRRTFDVLYDRAVFHVFQNLTERERFVQRSAQVLKPGGLWHSLLGSTDGPDRDVGPPRRSAVEITAAIEPYFEILTLNAVAFDQGRFGDVRAWNFVGRRRTRDDDTLVIP
jgi:SAM-dependent methyltransferase